MRVHTAEQRAFWLSNPANHAAFLTELGLATLHIASRLPTAVVTYAESDEPDDGD
jgi:hypothetical protein